MIMNRILLFLFVILLISCNGREENNRRARIKDSLEVVYAKLEEDRQTKKNEWDSIDTRYQELGFKDFCDIKLEDDLIYVAAATMADNKFPSNHEKRMEYELKTYDLLFKQWIKKNHINDSSYYRDVIKEASTYENFCGINNKRTLDIAKGKLKKIIAARQNINAEDLFEIISTEKKNAKSELISRILNEASEEDVIKWMSGVDGSIRDFKEKVKNNLHDPGSFEHVETAGSSKKNSTRIRMKFRAKNQFGAKVLNTAYADLNVKDGTVKNITIE